MKLMNIFEQRGMSKIGQLFDKTADAQRGAPEAAMLQLQFKIGGGVYPYVLEHVGDLTHRMSESFDFLRGGRENVQDKVEKTLRTLEHGYGFEKEMQENFKSNYRFRTEKGEITVPFEQWISEIQELSKVYADTHREVPVYNVVQETARDAAVALGEWDFDTARYRLNALKNLLNDGERYEEEVAKITRQEGMDSGTFLSKDLPQGVTGFPLPTDSKEYININSKRRGGAEVKIRHGNKTRANKKAKHTA